LRFPLSWFRSVIRQEFEETIYVVISLPPQLATTVAEQIQGNVPPGASQMILVNNTVISPD
jgi:hypothetical protein